MITKQVTVWCDICSSWDLCLACATKKRSAKPIPPASPDTGDVRAALAGGVSVLDQLKHCQWWRVECEELGPEATESVLAPTADQAATKWAEERGTDTDSELLVDVYAEAGERTRFALQARVVWAAKVTRERQYEGNKTQ
jgi:hypothetical protein